jgi:NADPH:quinone reductase-like Zn-dependent oxidoreductase
MVARTDYPLRSKERDVIPCSDMAGTVVAVGDIVKDWKEGDRVCVNFALNYIDGDVTPEIRMSGLGVPVDGVLREYIAVPAYVSHYCLDHSPS